MDWLLHNFIADMPGPWFLGVYAGFAVLVLAACYFSIRPRGRTKLLEPPDVPSKPDPYEIAYLRGGANEVIRVVVYALRQRGFIEVLPEKKFFIFTTTAAKLGQRRDRPDETLTDVEALIFDFVRQPKKASELFEETKQALNDDIYRLYRPYVARLVADNFFLSAPTKAEKLRIWFLGAVPLVALATYKIALAWSKELSNIGLLITITFVVTIIILPSIVDSFDHKISARGKAYLARLRLAYGGLGAGARSAVGNDRHLDYAAILMVGVFGLGILKGTPDAAFAQLFANAGFSSSCGGGFGSGDCGGGSGCGGCGGGGD